MQDVIYLGIDMCSTMAFLAKLSPNVKSDWDPGSVWGTSPSNLKHKRTAIYLAREVFDKHKIDQ